MLSKQQLARYIAPSLDRASSTYVWDLEHAIPHNDSVIATIGTVDIRLDLHFVHERRYALGLLFGFRNPQADIDHQLFRNFIRPGDVVLDAGANIGVTALEALSCGAEHVICIEPEEHLVCRLRELSERHSDQLTILSLALDAMHGHADLILSATHNQGHTISKATMALFPGIFGHHRRRVQTTTIDTVLSNKRANVWKLDIEGMEANAIRGARQVLQHAPPRTIFAELYDPFINDFIDLLPDYSIKRAAISKDDYTLRLISKIGGQLPGDFCQTSPTYVFTRRQSIQR